MNSSPINSEQQLLADIARGDRRATTEVYNEYVDLITRWIQKNGGTATDAADVYQEAIMVLFEKAHDEAFRLSCRIGTYLFAVSKYIWYKKLQQQQKAPSSLGDAGADEKEDWAYEDDIKAHNERENHYQQLNDALSQLGEPCSSLLKAFYHHDKSMQQIAAEFGYSNPDNAKTQKYKCLERLRKIFYGVKAK